MLAHKSHRRDQGILSIQHKIKEEISSGYLMFSNIKIIITGSGDDIGTLLIKVAKFGQKLSLKEPVKK